MFLLTVLTLYKLYSCNLGEFLQWQLQVELQEMLPFNQLKWKRKLWRYAIENFSPQKIAFVFPETLLEEARSKTLNSWNVDRKTTDIYKVMYIVGRLKNMCNRETVISRHLTISSNPPKIYPFQLGTLYLEFLYLGAYVVVVACGQSEWVRPGPNLKG